jgi:hypothetical protein
MFLEFVRPMLRLPHNQFSRNVILALACGLIFAAVGSSDSAPQQVYLLAGTPTNYSTDRYPVSLYRIKANRKLDLARVIVSGAEGLYSVRTDGEVFFVAHPADTPTGVSIVHSSNPQLKDEVVFNTDGLVSIKNREAMAEPTSASTNLLLPVTPLGSDASKGNLISVSSDSKASGQRVKSDTWNDYAALRLDGNPGGPAFNAFCCFGQVVRGAVVMSVLGHAIPVEVAPPLPPGYDPHSLVWLMVVSKEYSVVAIAPPAASAASAKVETSREMMVRDRIRDSWKKIRVEGALSRLRLFGPWLATIVGMENVDHKIGPGRENQRNTATALLPGTRDMYTWFANDNKVWMPGTLVLQNLEDDRELKIETAQEDSEILWAGNERVLYRVNDTIYQAGIAGNKIQDPVVIAKDEDVPEVHWAFWAQ